LSNAISAALVLLDLLERQSDGLTQFGLAQSDKDAPLPEPGANVNVYWVFVLVHQAPIAPERGDERSHRRIPPAS
jgi:hypothetical protein